MVPNQMLFGYQHVYQYIHCRCKSQLQSRWEPTITKVVQADLECYRKVFLLKDNKTIVIRDFNYDGEGPGIASVYMPIARINNKHYNKLEKLAV